MLAILLASNILKNSSSKWVDALESTQKGRCSIYTLYHAFKNNKRNLKMGGCTKVNSLATLLALPTEARILCLDSL
jgi:hypothetical protein